MFENILLAIIQAGTEFLPVSSSGHLALVSKIISEPNLFFFVILHVASLFAVLIFTRGEIRHLFHFDREYRAWWVYLFVGTVPAAVAGFFLKDMIEAAFSSLVFIGVAFLFTGCVLYFSKFHKERTQLNVKIALLIGLLQILALFPGVSRSGVTIAAGLLLGVEKEKALKFSFLLFIPLAVGALLLSYMSGSSIKGNAFYLSWSLIVSFAVSLTMSLVFLNLILHIIRRGRFWVFSAYCFAVGLACLGFYFL